MNNLSFRLMALFLKLSRKPARISEILGQCRLQPGEVIVDYGAGIGSYTVPAAQLVGPQGKVYGADIAPLSAKYIAKSAKKQGLPNVGPLTTALKLDLPDASVDVVLLFDVMHHLTPLKPFLEEFRRVLKPTGRLCLSVDHFDLQKSVKELEANEVFNLLEIKSNIAIFNEKQVAS